MSNGPTDYTDSSRRMDVECVWEWGSCHLMAEAEEFEEEKEAEEPEEDEVDMEGSEDEKYLRGPIGATGVQPCGSCCGGQRRE